MKRILLPILVALTLLLFPKPGFGQAPALGGASGFAVFTSAGAFNNLGPSLITGDIGYYTGGPISGFPPGTLIGSSHAGDAVSILAATDLGLAYADLATKTCGPVLGVTLGSGQVLTPNTYCTGAASTIDGTLTLNGEGNPSAIFIFKINGSLITGTHTSIELINGASMDNVFWQVNGLFTLGDYSIFRGTVIANGAINLLEGASYYGRALSVAGAISLHNNIINIGMPPLAGDDRTICLNDSTQIGAPANPGSTYSWTSDPPGFTSDLANPFVSPPVFTTYTVIETLPPPQGGTNTDDVEVTVNPLPDAVAGDDREICLNDSTELGAGEVTGNTYSWTSDPPGFVSEDSNPMVTPLVTTVYILLETITDTGCNKADSVTVTVNPLPDAVAGDDREICLNDSTELGADEVTGNTYSWTSDPPGFTSEEADPMVAPLVTTVYILTETITDTGCNKADSVTVTVNPLPDAVAGDDREICLNDSTELGADEVTGNTYSWTSDPPGFTSEEADPMVAPLVTTVYILTETITDTGCNKADSVTVTVNPLPDAVAGLDREICLNDSTELGADEVTGNTYSWTSDPPGFTSEEADPMVAPQVTTVYILTETITDTGCNKADSVTVTVNPLPDAVAGIDREICLNDSTELGADEVTGNTYSWTSDPPGFTSEEADPMVAPLVTTVYILTETITDTGCNKADSVTVTVNPLPDAVAGLDREICLNDSTELGADEVTGNTYSWTSDPPGFTSEEADPMVAPQVTTVYILTETITDTGCNKADSVTVTVNPLPDAIAGDDREICLNDSTELGADEVTGNTYSWTSDPPGFTSGEADPMVAPLVTTVYILIETITDTGCNKADSVMVTVNPLPDAVAGDDREICLNDSTELGADEVTGNTYSWTSDPPGFTSEEADPMVAPQVTTVYILSETITETGCNKADSVTVTVNPLPDAVAGDDREICLNDSTELGADEVTGNTYSWTSDPPGFTSEEADPMVAPQVTTVYILSETITETGCNKADSVTVTVIPLATAEAGNNSETCESSPFTITESTATNYVSLLWSTSGTGSFDDPSLLHPEYTPSDADILSGSVVLTMTSTPPEPCAAVSDEMVLTINKQAIVNAGVDTFIREGNTYTVSTATAQYVTSILWSHNGTGVLTDVVNLTPLYTPAPGETGVVTLTLTGYSAGRCATVSDEMTITINPDLGPGLTLTKTSAETSFSAVGNVIHYNLDVTNISNESIFNISVTDANSVISSENPIAMMGAGATTTLLATHIITQQDVDAGQVINCAFVSGAYSDGGTVADSSECITVNSVQRPQITATKYATEATYRAVGEVIHYTIEVFNCGNVTISDITVTDPNARLTGGGTISSLAPRQTVTATAEHIVTRTDLESASIVNIAAVSGTDPTGKSVRDDSNEVILYANMPAHLVAALFTRESSFHSIGDTIHYDIAIRNFRNTTMTDIFITDSNAFITSGSPIRSLASGRTAMAYAYHIVTQKDLNAGKVTNRVSARGRDYYDFIEQVWSNEVTVFAQQDPGLLLTKSAEETTFSTVGDLIHYSNEITNTGNVKVTGITLDDPNTISNGSNRIAALSPGESATIRTTHAISQADLNRGSVEKTASVTGTDPNSQPILNFSNKVIVTGSQKALMMSTLTASENTYSLPGEVIHYNLEVRNNGNVTLTDINLTDPDALFANIHPIRVLAPGNTSVIIAEHTINLSDVSDGKLLCTVNLSGYDPTGMKISSTSNELAIHANLARGLIVTEAIQETVFGKAGDLIHYTITVKNFGTVPVSGLTVSDPNTAMGPGSVIGSLPAGRSAVVTAIHEINQEDLDAGQIRNSASIAGRYPDGTSCVGQSNPVSIYAIRSSGMTTSFLAAESSYRNPGDQINYSIEVTNTGNQTISDIRLSSAGDLTVSNNPAVSLAPDQSTRLSAVYTVTTADLDAGKVIRAITVSGKAPDQQILRATGNEVTVTGLQNPELSASSSAGETSFSQPGEVIHYTILVKNSGNVTIISTAVTDPNAVIISVRPNIILKPGESFIVSAMHIITPEDINAGMVTHRAKAEGFDLKGDTITKAGNKIIIHGVQIHELVTMAEASVKQYQKVNDMIVYTVQVKNSGNVTMKDISISDGKGLLNFNRTIGSLAPGESATVSLEYLVTAKDMQAGTIITTPRADCFDANSLKFGYAANTLTVNLAMEVFNLSNFPNPFAYETTIVFDLPEKGEVMLKIYDVNGREVGEIDRKDYVEGRNYVNWKSSKIQKGIYLLKMVYQGNQATRILSVIY